MLDEYFALQEDLFDISQAYCDKASALKALGRKSDALKAYEDALEQERLSPGHLTQAYLNYAKLVIEMSETNLYRQALDILDAARDRPMFPVDRYIANGARAILLMELEQKDQAKAAANLALSASRETKSGFRYHPLLGLVTNLTDTFYRRVARIAR